MAAVAVPPSGWTPIGARELLAHARRNFGQGLVLSAIAHGALLGLILWLTASADDPSVRVFRTPIDILPTPPSILPPIQPPDTAEPPSNPAQNVDFGIIEPVPPDRPIDTRTVDFNPPQAIDSGPPRGGDKPGPGEITVTQAPPLPREHDVVLRDTEPVAIYDPKPVYPDWAREAGITGRVLLHVLVDRDGTVAQVTVIRSVLGLDDAAKAGLSRWKFKPALFNGHPVAVWIEIPVNFRLEP